MTPWKDGGSGSYVLDRRFRHIGRIKRSSGTGHLPTVKRIDQMLTTLFETGRWDILRAIRDGAYSPLQVYAAFRASDLENLPTAPTIAPLKSTLDAWVESYDCSPVHRVGLKQSIRHIVAAGGSKATIGDLPAILFRLKGLLNAAPRAFNRTRSAAQAFVRSTMKKSHPLWKAITDVTPLKAKPSRASHPLTPDEMREITGKLEARHAATAWAMALTGMGPGEYWGKWNIKRDRIHIEGTKRSGRVRDVPLVQRIPTPYASPKAFAEALQHRIGIKLTPYDFRRTYANWMEGAGIPRTRRRLYMGHGTRDITDLYEAHEVAAFLVEDAEKLRAYVFAEAETKLEIVK